MHNLKNKLLAIFIIGMAILITAPTVFAQSPRNYQTRYQNRQQVQRQNKQPFGMWVRKMAWQNRWLRFINRMQHRKVNRLQRQVHRHRVAERKMVRKWHRNHSNYNNYNNQYWGRR